MRSFEFEERARRLGAPVIPENTLGVVRGRSAVMVGVDPALPRIDPQSFADGVRVGVGYFNVPRLKPSLARGFYLLRTRIERIDLGFQKGEVEALDEHGRPAGAFSAEFEVSALTVPAEAQGRVLLRASPAVLDPEPEDDDICVGIEWECDNGAKFCIGFVFDPTPVDPPE